MASPAKNIIVIGAVSVALAAAGVLPAYAFAAPSTRTVGAVVPGPRRFGFKYVGTVSSVEGSSITLAGEDGALHVVDARDAHIVKAGAPATTAAVAVGDPIAVIGSAQREAAPVGTTAPAPRGSTQNRNVTIGGSVVAVDPGAITLIPKSHPGRPARPMLEIALGTQTIVTSAGRAVFPDAITAGAQVVVSGVRDARGDMTAEKVVIRT